MEDANKLISDTAMPRVGVWALDKEGIMTVGQLRAHVAKHGRFELARIPNFGNRSLASAMELVGHPAEMSTPDETLRDKFAGQALAGMLARGNPESLAIWAICEDAYRYADEMLKARVYPAQ